MMKGITSEIKKEKYMKKNSGMMLWFIKFYPKSF